MTFRKQNSGSRFNASIQGVGGDAPKPCQRGCCWSPYGHSTVRDIYPPTHPKACHCHDTEGEAA